VLSYKIFSDFLSGRTPDGRGRGFAHIEYASTQEASGVVDALRDEPRMMQGRQIKVDFAPPRMRNVSEPYHVLYVSGFIGTEQELRAAFKDHESNILGARLCLSFFSLPIPFFFF
jgi:hypothetical protein